jgi:Protein of unknown function (DUF4238)
MTMKKGRRDHYLPQSYLRGFIDPARESLAQPLWHLDIRYPNWRMRATKEVGYIKGLYDYAGDSPELEAVETADDAFRQLENEFDSVRSWLIGRGFRNWHKRLGFLLRYMQMIRARSPLFLQQKKAEGETLEALVIKEIHPDRKTWTVGDPAPLSPPQINNWTITNMREEIRGGAGWMGDFNWALRYCESVDNPFVTSESPLVIEGSTTDIAKAIDHPESLIIFPICWQACLFGSRLRFDKGTDKFGLADMRTTRRKYRHFAQKFLLSPTKLDDITQDSAADSKGTAVSATG